MENDDRQQLIDLARDMKELLEDDRFKRLFEKGYIEDWANTQTHNVAMYNEKGRARVQEEMLARSVFSQYCSAVIDAGNEAKESLAEDKAMEEE